MPTLTGLFTREGLDYQEDPGLGRAVDLNATALHFPVDIYDRGKLERMEVGEEDRGEKIKLEDLDASGSNVKYYNNAHYVLLKVYHRCPQVTLT